MEITEYSGKRSKTLFIYFEVEERKKKDGGERKKKNIGAFFFFRGTGSADS